MKGPSALLNGLGDLRYNLGMKKHIFSLLAAVAAAGCCICNGGEPVKISVFSGTVERIAKAKGVSLGESAALLAEAGVTGFDSSYKDPKLPELAKTGLKPINFFGWPKLLGPDGGAKDSDEFVAAAVKYGVPRIMVVPDEFSKDGDQEADYLRIREGLRKLVAKANAVGITVTVEDYGGTGNPCSYTKYLKRFLTDIPELGYALDSGNLYYAGRGEDILWRIPGGRNYPRTKRLSNLRQLSDRFRASRNDIQRVGPELGQRRNCRSCSRPSSDNPSMRHPSCQTGAGQSPDDPVGVSVVR